MIPNAAIAPIQPKPNIDCADADHVSNPYRGAGGDDAQRHEAVHARHGVRIDCVCSIPSVGDAVLSSCHIYVLRISVTFAALIAPGPQQVGLSVIPDPPTPYPAPSHVIPAKAGISLSAVGSHCSSPSFPHPPTSFPHPTHVIPAKAGISRCAIRRTAWRVAVPNRHAAKVNSKILRRRFCFSIVHDSIPDSTCSC